MEATRELLESPEGAEAAARVRALVQDDPLLILRVAAAIAENRGMWPADSVTRACREEVELLADVAPATVRRELEACLLGRDVDEGLQWLQSIGAVALLLPELEACVALEQEAGRAHKDVWEHTKLVVKQAVRRPAVRWGALLHDIGKVPTRTFTANGVHFHGHAEVGARMFDKLCRRIPFDRPMRQTIRFLIKHHLRAAQYSPSWTDSAVRRFHRELAPHLTDLLDLSRADITSKRPGRRKALLRQISELSDRIDRVVAEDARVPPLPKGLGNELMQRFGLAPSKALGNLMKAIEAAAENGTIESHREVDYYADWLNGSELLATALAEQDARGKRRP